MSSGLPSLSKFYMFPPVPSSSRRVWGTISVHEDQTESFRSGRVETMSVDTTSEPTVFDCSGYCVERGRPGFGREVRVEGRVG